MQPNPADAETVANRLQSRGRGGGNGSCSDVLFCLSPPPNPRAPLSVYVCGGDEDDGG